MTRSAVFVTAVIGALAVTAAAIAAGAADFGPFGSKSHRVGQAAAADVPAMFEPGATVTHNSDGTLSVIGTIKPDVAAERRQAGKLLDAGPQSITCLSGGPKLRCSALTDTEALAALRRGVLVYQRTVHGGITQSAIDRRTPFFSPSELTCASASGALTCARAADAPPAIAEGETAVVSYRPLHVRFEGASIVERPEKATIPLARAGR